MKSSLRFIRMSALLFVSIAGLAMNIFAQSDGERFGLRAEPAAKSRNAVPVAKHDEPDSSVTGATPEWPMLLSPICDGSYYAMWKQIFRWTPSPNATGYRLQIADNLLFDYSSRPAILDTTLADTSLPIKLPYPVKRFYWRVMAFNKLDSSDWSACQFQVIEGVGVNERRDAAGIHMLHIDLDPATHRGTIRLTVVSPRSITLAIHDLRGNLVNRIDAGNQESGNHSFPIDCSGLPSGRYIISSDGISVPFVVIK